MTLCAVDLRKAYRGRQVVKRAGLRVERGEIVGLLGPNGAGKTTTFYMVVGLVPCDAGSITLHDQDITHTPMHERARAGLGYLPQEASVFRKLTVRENLLAALELRRELTSVQRGEILNQLLQEFNIGHLRDQLGISLSGGERRRVEIARALAAEPAYILLDEPFAGVDPISVMDIQKIIRHLSQRGIGVLITDHDVQATLGICERAYILSQGEVIVEGSPQEIANNEHARRVYLGEHFRL
jgi:lipopolysaccharide export system ATP-binding protein